VTETTPTLSPEDPEVRRLLQESMDWRLSAAEEQHLEAHLRTCRGCREYRRELLDLRTTLRGAALVAFPEDALESVWQKTVRAPESPRSWARRLAGWKPLAAAAVLVLALLWPQFDVPREQPALSDADLDRLAADTRLVLLEACRALGRVERIATQEVLDARVGAVLRYIPWPGPLALPESTKESNGEHES